MSEKIRIYAIIPVKNGLGAWREVHYELLSCIASPDVEITVADLPDAPIEAIGNAFDAQLVGLWHVKAALKAEQEGYHAVAMGCLDEPGVSAAKEALSIPVIGEAEAAMHFASMVGRRFTFLLPGPQAGKFRGGDGARCLEDIVRQYGFHGKLASIRSVPAGTLDFAAQQENIPQAMLEQARLAVAKDGADVVIGYGGLDVIGFLQEHLDIPVIDPIQASAMMAESLVRLQIGQSRRAFPTPSNLNLLTGNRLRN